MSAFDLYGLVLSGGQSRRMGIDKASLRLGDKTLLEIAQDTLTACGCSEVRVSSNHLDGAIQDEYELFGPVAGIHAGLSSYCNDNKTGHLVVLPIDMPLLQAKTLNHLSTKSAQYDLVRFADYQLPLVISLNKTSLDCLAVLLDSTTVNRGISLKRMFREFNEHIIQPVSETEQEFVNCNSEADYTEILSLYR